METAPSNGSLVLSVDGGFTYTPGANYYGADTFSYTVTDGKYSDTAMVTLTINRITSYNVCYTKLLRPFSLLLPKHLQSINLG